MQSETKAIASSSTTDKSRSVHYRTDATADLALALGLAERALVFVADRLLADPAGQRTFHRSHVPFTVAADVPALEADPFHAPGELYGAPSAAGHELMWIETVRVVLFLRRSAGGLNVLAEKLFELAGRCRIDHDAEHASIAACSIHQ